MLTTENIAGVLNKFIEEPEVRSAVSKIIGAGVPATDKVLNHPTILVEVDEDRGLQASVGFMGLLNGVLRVLKQPILVAHVDDDGTDDVVSFSARERVHREPDPVVPPTQG